MLGGSVESAVLAADLGWNFVFAGHINGAPELIAQNRHMVTVNGALAVDLAGQVVADTINGTQFSGIGGHEDFVSGPGLSADGFTPFGRSSWVER